jgi:hypothetical protein
MAHRSSFSMACQAAELTTSLQPGWPGHACRAAALSASQRARFHLLDILSSFRGILSRFVQRLPLHTP